jgi:replicative DNA helicase
MEQEKPSVANVAARADTATVERPDALLPTPTILLPPQLTDGLVFALDAAGDVVAVWGSGTDVAWAKGEPTLLVAPDGLGKTSLAQRLALPLVGVGSDMLGLPVEQADGMVLYVAADRPKQGARSLWRMLQGLGAQDHGKIKAGLLVWRGPLPFDIVKDDPSSLAEWAAGFGASHLIIDSLGFVVAKLSDDETGSAIARSFAAVSVAGIELFANYHPRKATAENKKPDSLADVYGSRWITSACGSVLSLWGNPGDPVMELRQLKSPSGEVGPVTIELEHETGAFSLLADTDLLGVLRASPAWMTARDGAAYMQGASEKAREVKARRRFTRFERDGLAHRREGEAIRGSVKAPDRWFQTPPAGVQEPLG